MERGGGGVTDRYIIDPAFMYIHIFLSHRWYSALYSLNLVVYPFSFYFSNSQSMALVQSCTERIFPFSRGRK